MIFCSEHHGKGRVYGFFWLMGVLVPSMVSSATLEKGVAKSLLWAVGRLRDLLVQVGVAFVDSGCRFFDSGFERNVWLQA